MKPVVLIPVKLHVVLIITCASRINTCIFTKAVLSFYLIPWYLEHEKRFIGAEIHGIDSVHENDIQCCAEN